MSIPNPRGDGFRVAAWSGLTDPAMLETIAAAPFDVVVLDMQHGLHDVASVHQGLRTVTAARKPVIVRVPLGELGTVSRALDFGAAGIILPMIESVEDGEAFVSVAKYAPLGQRSFGPSQAVRVHGYADTRSYMEDANAATLAIAMIETKGAYRDLDDILAVEGLDGVLVGPADLSLALTGTLDPDGAATAEASAQIARKARAAGKLALIYVSGEAASRRAKEQGFDLACSQVDDLSDAAAASARAAALRG